MTESNNHLISKPVMVRVTGESLFFAEFFLKTLDVQESQICVRNENLNCVTKTLSRKVITHLEV